MVNEGDQKVMGSILFRASILQGVEKLENVRRKHHISIKLPNLITHLQNCSFCTILMENDD